jgi:hypothetical protein
MQINSVLLIITLHVTWHVNPLNAELNPICRLLLLLGDLTFMGPCFLSIFQYMSNRMQRYTVHLYLETALHVSGGTSTHHQESIQLYLQHFFICHTVTAICRYRGRVGTGLSVLWVAYASTPEQFPDISKLCKVVSCWIYIGVLFGAHSILHISKIRVNNL